MYLADLVFPKRIAMNAQRAPKWETQLTQTGGGHVYTQQDWQDALHTFDLSFAVRIVSDYDAIAQHFHSARGRRHTFPFPDPLDYRVTQARGIITDADDDSPTTAFQLRKTYGTGSMQWARRISRPKSGTVNIYRLRAGNTTDITASSTIDYETGLVTFSGGVYLPGSGDVLSWSGDFWVPARYGADTLPGLIVDKRPGMPELDGLLVRCESITIEEDRDEDEP